MAKRTLRTIAVVLFAVIMTTTLCACSSILFPGGRAEWEDETHEAVLYNEKRYVLYKEKDVFSCFKKVAFDLSTGYFRDETGSVFSASKDEKVLNVSDGKRHKLEFGDKIYITYDKYFVPEDEYATITEEYEKIYEAAEHFCYDDPNTSWIQSNYVLFSDEMTEGLKCAIEEECFAPNSVRWEETDASSSYEVKICNDDMSAVFDFGYLYFHFKDNTINFYLANLNMTEPERIYTIPEKYKKAFALFIKENIKNVVYYQ